MVAATRDRRREQAGAANLVEAAWIGLLIGAFALYYASPWLPLSLLLLALCAALCYARLPLAVSLTPLAMPFFMLPKHLTNHLEFSLGETAIVLCCGAFMLRRALEIKDDAAPSMATPLWRRFIPASPLERTIALFLVAATVATLTAHFRHFALRQYRLVILEPIAYYVLVVALLRGLRDMARALWAVVGAGVLVAVLGIAQYLVHPVTSAYFTGTASRPVKHPLRLATSVYGSANNLGLLLDRAIPVAVALALAAVAMTYAPRAGRLPRAALAAGLAIVLMAAALALSGSRGGMITALAASVIAALLWRGRRDRRLELAGAGVVILGIAAVLWKVRHGLSTDTRVNVWLSALRMIRDHPLLGVGPDNFLYYYYNPQARSASDPSTWCIADPRILPAKHYMNMTYAWQEPCLSHPHNVLLDAWLSTGLVGLVALVLVVAGFALLALHGLRVLPLGVPRALQVACIAVVVATLAHGLVDNSIFVPDLAVTFWLALALTANLATLPPERVYADT